MSKGGTASLLDGSGSASWPCKLTQDDEAHSMPAYREAYKSARNSLPLLIRVEDPILEELRRTDEQIAACLSLCVLVSGYVLIDVCGRQWPNEKNLRGLAGATAESSKEPLTAEEAYAYLTRVVLLGESLEKVLSPPHRAGTLCFVITGELLLRSGPDDQEWWEYLDKIEEFWEIALAVDLDLLPALMLRSQREPAS